MEEELRSSKPSQWWASNNYMWPLSEQLAQGRGGSLVPRPLSLVGKNKGEEGVSAKPGLWTGLDWTGLIMDSDLDWWCMIISALGQASVSL